MTNSMAMFKKKIVKWILILALGCELLSLIFLGFNIQFVYGLALGTSVAIVNFYIMVFSGENLLRLKQGDDGSVKKYKTYGYSLFVYIIRYGIFGIAFYKSMQINHISAIGTGIGFLLLVVSIYVTQLGGMKSKYI